MRKTLFVLIMLLAAGMLSAATSVTLTDEVRSDNATLTVTLPLKSGGFEFITVGFTGNEVSNATTGTLATVTPLEATEVELAANGDNTASLATDLYAYWQIRTDDTVTVSLSKEKALEGSNPSETIDWKITAADKTQNMSDYDTTNAISLVDRWVKGEDAEFNQGSAKISIDTANYSGKTTDDYSANLVLTVTAVGA